MCFLYSHCLTVSWILLQRCDDHISIGSAPYEEELDMAYEKCDEVENMH